MACYESESRTETSMPEDGMAGQGKIQVKEIQILCEEVYVKEHFPVKEIMHQHIIKKIRPSW